MKVSTPFLLFNLIISLFIFLFVFSDISFAATFYDKTPPSGPNYSAVSASFCGGPAECANSQNDGNCGLATCTGGNAWTKYQLTCIYDDEFLTYDSYYEQGESICSIGDKCIAGDTGLRAGFCDCSQGASNYKYCCSATGNAESCTTAGATQDNNDPSEGQCPGGYIVDGSRVRDSSCVPISGPPPPPPPPPPDPEVIPFCGDGICNNGEDTNSCPQDCGYPPPPPSCQFSGCGGTTANPCDTTDVYVSGGCSGYSWFSGNGCYVDNTKCVSVPPPPTDNAPVCSSFAITDAYGAAITSTTRGNRITIKSTISDSDATRVSSTELFVDGSLEAGPFNNSLSSEPFSQTVGFDTTALSTGSHTFTINAIDSAGKTMSGAASACSGKLQINPPSNWFGPSCSTSNTFSGCAQAGQSRCTDFGDINQPTWNQCNDACNRTDGSGNKNPDLWCKDSSGSISVSTSIGRSNTSSTWDDMTISISLNPLTEIGNVSYRKGLCSASPASSSYCGLTGWTPLKSNIKSGSFTWTPSSSMADGIYTFGLLNQINNKLYGVDDSSFQTTTTPITPPPPPSGCSICMGGNCNSTALSGSIGTSFDITSNNPTTPQTINITGPTNLTYGPFSTNSQQITWNTTGWEAGSYNISNGCTSRTVSLKKVAVSCSQEYGYNNVDVYTFSDPAFDASKWPQYNWVEGGTSGYGACQSSEPTASLENSSQVLVASAVLAATSCMNNSDCNDNNLCTADGCVGAMPFGPYFDYENGNWGFNFTARPGACQYNPSITTVDSVCGTTEYGGNMYCGRDSRNSPSGQCSDKLCDSRKNTNGATTISTNADCNDGNSCTIDNCTPPSVYNSVTETSDYVPGIGTCTPKNQPYQSVCTPSTSYTGTAYCGGNASNREGDGICHIMPATAGSTVNISSVLCKTNTDCNDGNTCTTDLCSGYTPAGCTEDGCVPETLGTCSRSTTSGNTNLPATSVCLYDASGNSQKLCSGGSPSSISPTYSQFVLSQCNVDYSQCKDITKGLTETGGTCCGTKNVQGQVCNGDCKLAQFPDAGVFTPPSYSPLINGDSKNPLRPKLGTVEIPITNLPGVVIHIDNEQCNIHKTQKTDSTGHVRFIVAPYIGDSAYHETLQYRVWAEIPKTYQFTRGTHISTYAKINQPDPQGNLDGVPLGPGGTPAYNFTGLYSSSSSGDEAGKDLMTFGFQVPNLPWIQTTVGDVHSNTRINTPGGPR